MVTQQTPKLVLDIGTHKVLGLAIRPTEAGVHVLASSYVPHPRRAMRDGQVHDVPAVARTLRRVVDDLERTLRQQFTGAYIAAAGRALRTSRGTAARQLSRRTGWTPDMDAALEWDAVTDAQANLLATLPDEDHAKGFYCIAHTRVANELDGEPLGTLTGQSGRQFGTTVLATFLPAVVVDSLDAVLKEAGLDMKGLTLEPVAALEAVIPPTMRHLNLILIDVGAGTADMVFTGDESVRAFAMVPQGGDSMTEALADELLLDFGEAESVKQTAARGETAETSNVLGDSVTVGAEQLQAIVRAPAEQLAERIAAVVEKWTPDTRPDALLLVGGASRTPGLAETLARRLHVPANRIAVRDRGAVRNVTGADDLTGPDAVTALGIALRATAGTQLPPVRVWVNGRPVSLFQPERYTVREAARIAGVPLAQLVGGMGRGITVTVNGDLLTLPGTRGRAAVVHVNGEPGSLDTVLNNKDEVEIEPAQKGAPAPPMTVARLLQRWLRERHPEVADGRMKRIQLDGVWQDVPLSMRRNGTPARADDVVRDRDELEFRTPRTARQLAAILGKTAGDAGTCTVNGREVALAAEGAFLRNGQRTTADTPIEDGDTWEWIAGEPRSVADVLEAARENVTQTLRITLNDKETTVEVPPEIRRNGNNATPDEPVVAGDEIEVRRANSVPLFQILPYAGVTADMTTAGERGRLLLLVSGKPAGFTTPIVAGDDVIIRYE